MTLTRDWRIWRRFELRSAGFPATFVDSLACPELQELARQVVDAEAAGGEASVAPLRSVFDARLTRERERILYAVRALAEDERLREAIAWQNINALVWGVDRLIAAMDRPGGARVNSTTRKRMRLVARYALRYALKNDTIGFFGPAVWARFVDEPGMRARIGPRLVAERRVFLEPWGVRALADVLSQDPRLAPSLAPRRLPHIRVESDLVVDVDRGQTTPIERREARLLAACDGARAARELAASRAEPDWDEDAVLAALRGMEQRGWIRWALEIPNITDRPEVCLRRQLERVTDDEARGEALAALGQIERARDELARAAGSAEAVREAMEQLQRRFTALTQQPGTRRPGQVYAGRTLAFEECVRDVDVEVGTDALAALAGPLALLLHSARWYTHAVAARYRAALEQAYEALARERGTTRIPVSVFVDRTLPLFPCSAHKRGRAPLIEEVADELRAKWAAILGLESRAAEAADAARGDERRPITLDTAAIAPVVADVFAAPGPGWPTARYHSPDIMLAAADPGAIAAGRFSWVLGELHAGVNSTEMFTIHWMHSDSGALVRDLSRDLPRPRITRAIGSDFADRAFIAPMSDGCVDWSWGETLSWRDRERVIPSSELLVERGAASLIVRTRDGAQTWDIIEFFDHMLMFDAVSLFGVASGNRVPRIAIGDLIIQRQMWRFEADEVPLRASMSHAELYLGAQRWARAHGLPRHVYYSFSDGVDRQKPMPLDFSSPLGLEVFVRLIRASPYVAITERLPTHDQLWMRDSDGARYCSELRVVAVDTEPWRAPEAGG